MWSPFAKIRDDAEIRRTAKGTGIPTKIARLILEKTRVCDLRPRDYKEWLAWVPAHYDSNADFVQRRRTDGSGERVWIHRDCALIWEGMDEITRTLPQLEHVAQIVRSLGAVDAEEDDG